MFNITSHQGDVNQSHSEVGFHTHYMIIKKKKTRTRTGKDIETLELSYTVGGNVKWCLQSGKQFGGFFQS